MSWVYDTPWMAVTKEGSPGTFEKMQQVRKHYEEQSGTPLDDDRTAVYGDSTRPMPCIMSMSKCPACGPEMTTGLRQVSDFFSEARKRMGGMSAHGAFRFDDLLPTEPFVATAVDDDGTYMAMLTWTKEGQRDNPVYPELADTVMDMIMEMVDVAFTVARMKRATTCKEARAKRDAEAATKN